MSVESPITTPIIPGSPHENKRLCHPAMVQLGAGTIKRCSQDQTGKYVTKYRSNLAQV